MLGLMKPLRSCGAEQNTLRNAQRLQYCGTCKVMGQKYGQWSRMTLNYDTVFLAELLEQFSQDNSATWEEALQEAGHCFTMPEEEAPKSLEFAAFCNVLFVQLKLRDNIADSKGFLWSSIYALLKGKWANLEEDMQKFGLEASYFDAYIREQTQIEGEAKANFTSVQELLAHYAGPTRGLFALLLERAAIYINRPELKETFSQIGEQFAELVYAVDAYKDLERDYSKREFNPLLLYFGRTAAFEESSLQAYRQHCMDLLKNLEERLLGLEVEESTKYNFVDRLRSSVGMQLYQEQERPETWLEYWKMRWRRGEEVATDFLCYQENSYLYGVQHKMIAFAVFIAPQSTAYQKEGESFSWQGFAMALLAGMGLYWGRSVRERKKSKKELRKERRKKRRIRKAWKRFWKKTKKSDCGSCAGSCASGCCEVCCESCCQSFCEGCGNECGDFCCGDDCGSKQWWKKALFFVLGLIIITVIIVFLALVL